jgi:hypothetical protein
MTDLAGGFKLAHTLRDLLPEGGNLRHLSASGSAKKGALRARFKWVSDILTNLTARLARLPKAVVLKGVLAFTVLLLGAFILLLAGFGAYHLFIFKGNAPRAPQSALGPASLPQPEETHSVEIAASSATAAHDPTRAADQKAGASPQTRRDDHIDGEIKPAAVTSGSGDRETAMVKKAIPAAAGPPEASTETELEAVPRKKPATDLKPKPSSAAVTEQAPASIDQAALSSETAPAGTKAPLMLYKASICTAIEDRMPAGVGERFAWTTPRIFVWSLLSANVPPVKVHHRYFFEDELVSDVTLKVGSSYWRTWSFHTLSGQLHIGAWHVDITTEDGRVLRRLHFAIE